MENNQKEIVLLRDLGMLSPKETSNYKKRYGLYKCFCGSEFKAQAKSIKSKHTKSCGCIGTSNKHNLTHHRLYKTWLGMMQRCNNPKQISYKYYGAKGIKVCNKWLDINNFIEDMYPSFQEGLTIDRIDVNGNYEPTNCRWSTKTVQSRNTRKLMCNNTSHYRGVHFDNTINKWIAKICVNFKRIHIGTFNVAIDGALAYDNYVIENNLEHTKNFEY